MNKSRLKSPASHRPGMLLPLKCLRRRAAKDGRFWLKFRCKSIELEDLKALKQSHRGSSYVFASERRTKILRGSFNRVLKAKAKHTDIPINVVPHALRHACRYELANKGTELRRLQQYLGHRSILSTVMYTDLAGAALDDIWIES